MYNDFASRSSLLDATNDALCPLGCGSSLNAFSVFPAEDKQTNNRHTEVNKINKLIRIFNAGDDDANYDVEYDDDEVVFSQL